MIRLKFYFWFILLFHSSTAVSQATFSDVHNQFYTIDLQTCEIEKTFTIDIPPGFQSFESWMSGITFSPAGDLYGVDGFNLFQINSSNDVLSRLDSILPDEYDSKRWMSLTSDDNGLLYFGTFGWYIYSTDRKEIIAKPNLIDEQNYGYFLGSDITFNPASAEILNINTWNSTFYIISIPLLRTKQYKFNHSDQLYFRALALNMIECFKAQIYIIDFQAREDYSIIYEITNIENQIYEPRCTIPVTEISGFTNAYAFSGKPMNVSAQNLKYDYVGGFTISVSNFCNSVSFGEIDFYFEMCHSIDSLRFVHIPTMSVMSSLQLIEDSDSSSIWINSDQIDNQELLAELHKTTLVWKSKNQNEVCQFFIYSGSAKTKFTFHLEQKETCESYNDQLIYFPNAFTPNNDGNNDMYEYYPRDYVQIKKFEVFDKLGRLVFKGSPNEPFWPGPDPPTSDVFIFSCEFEDTLFKELNYKTGSIHVLY